MATQTVNLATVPFVELDAIMKVKAEATIKFAVCAIEAHVEELHQMADVPVPPRGCGVVDRLKRHLFIKRLLTDEPEWWGETDSLSCWGGVPAASKIHMVKDEVEVMLIELRKLVGQKLDDQSREMVTVSVNELEHILDNLANEPADPDYCPNCELM